MIICKYCVAFFFYSFLGFIYESIYSSIRKRSWQSRGFFYGPIIPIYGVGACIATLVFFDLHIKALQNANIFVIFIIGFVGSIILEYTTSYILEKIFHAVWWDYSKSFMNINGRVCLFASIGFGIAAVVIVRWIIPFVENVLSHFPDALMVSLSLLFVLILGADFALTVSALTNFQKNFTKIENEINEQMSLVYDNLENSFISTKDNISSKKDAFLEKHLSDKTKMIAAATKEMIDTKVSNLVDSSANWEKQAISRIAAFREEGKRKTITNSFSAKLQNIKNPKTDENKEE